MRSYGRIREITVKTGFAFVEFERQDDAVSTRVRSCTRVPST